MEKQRAALHQIFPTPVMGTSSPWRLKGIAWSRSRLFDIGWSIIDGCPENVSQKAVSFEGSGKMDEAQPLVLL